MDIGTKKAWSHDRKTDDAIELSRLKAIKNPSPSTQRAIDLIEKFSFPKYSDEALLRLLYRLEKE